MLKVGKLDSEVLKSIVIDKINYKRPEVKTRASVGEDCAVIDYGPYECVISTDPIFPVTILPATALSLWALL